MHVSKLSAFVALLSLGAAVPIADNAVLEVVARSPEAGQLYCWGTQRRSPEAEAAAGIDCSKMKREAEAKAGQLYCWGTQKRDAEAGIDCSKVKREAVAGQLYCWGTQKREAGIDCSKIKRAAEAEA